jgi:hypothetical protein
MIPGTSTIAGTAFAIFGLQAKGISLDQVKVVIAALGTVVNDFVILVGALGTIYATVKGVSSSSPSGQAAAIGANSKAVVNATPGGGAKDWILRRCRFPEHSPYLRIEATNESDLALSRSY